MVEATGSRAPIVALYCPSLPPVPGGVADHTRALALALHREGVPLAVYGARGDPDRLAPVPTRVDIRPRDLARTMQGAGLRQLILQYVPFLYARRGVSRRFIVALEALHGAGVRIAAIVHEPYVPFTRLSWWITGVPMRWQFRALVRSASFVYTPVPRFAELARRHAMPDTTVRTAPVGSTLPLSPVSRDDARRALGLGSNDVAIGVFSPGAAGFRTDWLRAAVAGLGGDPHVVWVMFGSGSEGTARGFAGHPSLRVLGWCEAETAARTFRALDLAVAPYVDGLTLRRTSAMASLANGLPLVSSTGPLYDPTAGDLAICASTAKDFAARVRRLVGDAAHREEIARRAQQYDAVASTRALAVQLVRDLDLVAPRR